MRRATSRLLTFVLSALLAAIGTPARAKTINQVSYARHAYNVGKLTRGYTTSNPNIQRAVFGVLGAGAAFNAGGSDYVGLAVDPLWGRLVYSPEGQAYCAAEGLLRPVWVDVSCDGWTAVAEQAGDRVSIYRGLGTQANGDPEPEIRGYISDSLNFQAPSQVLWDDYGTQDDSGDDVVWVLDRTTPRIVGYHVHSGTGTTPKGIFGTIAWGTLYASLGVATIPTAKLYQPVSIAKRRTFSVPTETGSFASTKLVLFDSGSNSFVDLDVPRNAGQLDSTALASSVQVTITPNPVPGTYWGAIVSDAWGNLLAIDTAHDKIYKFSPTYAILDVYGSRGKGDLGTEQMWQASSISFVKDVENFHGRYTGAVVLCESWGDQTGVQCLSMGVTARDLVLTMNPGSLGGTFSYFLTEHAKIQIQVLDPGTGAVIGTATDDAVQPAGADTLVWNGTLLSGTPLSACGTYDFRLRAISLYDSPETTTVTTRAYYKPPTLATLRVTTTNVVGSGIRKDDRDTTIVGNTIAWPCSVCTTHTLAAPGAQNLSGIHFCFGAWGNGGPRSQSILVRADSTLTLGFIQSGAGPTYVSPGATLYNDAYDCKSPYIFQGGASLTTSSPSDTFRTWGSVKFRLPKATGSQTRASLAVSRPFRGSGLTFETVDSTSAFQDNLWAGIRLDANGSLFLDGCSISNADIGIGNSDINIPAATVDVRNSSFIFNRTSDINVWFDAARSPSAFISGNTFNDKQGLQIAAASTSLNPVATATILGNRFISAPTQSGFASLDIKGAWQGQVSGNTFTGLGTTGALGMVLNQYLSYGSPSVTINNNTFGVVSGNSRYALKTATGPVTSINATLNDWNIYDATQIPDVIIDGQEFGGGRAIAIFQPFTTPSGGGGGGSGGCPFLLSWNGTCYQLENSILGLSEQTAFPALVSDACPATSAKSDGSGRVRIRVVELESETDQLDYLALGSVQLAEGEEIGANSVGAPVVFRRDAQELRASSWTGREGPSIAAISPNIPLSGQRGDSLDLTVDPAGDVGRPIAIHLQHKNPAGGIGGIASVGVVVRVSPDTAGENWVTIGTLVPRETWSTTVLELASLRGVIPRRIRLVWNAEHSLSWVGFVQARTPELTYLPLVSATHSNGSSVRDVVARRDDQSTWLRTGQYVDLEFDATSIPADRKLVFVSHGRYVHAGTTSTPSVPAAYYLGANRPNPFNPETEVEFGLPRTSAVQVSVFDVSGRLVRNLLKATLPAGVHAVRWNGKNNQGRDVGSGVYYLDLRASDFRAQRRMVLLR